MSFEQWCVWSTLSYSLVEQQCKLLLRLYSRSVRLKPNSVTLAGSELVGSWFEAAAS